MEDATKLLLDTLKIRHLTLGSVESLTAGLFGATFCNVPGSSAVYRGGLITYSPALKTSLAHVEEETIEKLSKIEYNICIK